MKNGVKTMKDAMKEFVESRDNAIPLFELGAMDSDIRGRALTLYGLEIAGAQEDSDVRALGGDHLEAVCKELEELRKGKSARVKVLVGKFQRALQEHHSHLQETRPMAGGLSDGYLSALTKWGVALRREGDALKGFFRAADDAGWMDGDKKREGGTAKARLDGSGALDALEGLHPELRGVTEWLANLAADKRKTSKARRDAGRMGGEESARQRADGERKRKLAAALQRMRREIATGKSIRQAARDAMLKGEPLLKSNGEPLREDSLVRYFKAAKSKGGA